MKGGAPIIRAMFGHDLIYVTDPSGEVDWFRWSGRHWQRIPAVQREEMFHRKLLTEASGILNWMIEGFLRWRGEGFQVPDGVVQDTARWHGENDPLADFLVYAMEAKPPALAHERSADLYSAYEAWCAEAARDPISKKAFGIQLGNKGYQSWHSNGTYYGARIAGDKPIQLTDAWRMRAQMRRRRGALEATGEAQQDQGDPG